MALSVKYSSSSLSANVDKMGEKLGTTILMYAATKASELQATMKSNRPWVDRTGMAKAQLGAKVSQPNNTTIRITLAHGVDYGIWLELAKNKRYAIIAPTVRTEATKLVSDLGDLMGKLRL